MTSTVTGSKMISRIGVALVVLILMTLTGGTAYSQAAPPRPYSLENVITLIRGGYTTAELLEDVRGRCISFRLDASAETQLRQEGAELELVTGLRSICSTVTRDVPALQAPARPAPQAEADAAAGARFSSRGAAIRSLLVPGLGQFYTRRPVVGAAFLAAAGGALAVGAMSESRTIVCAVKTSNGDCSPIHVISDDSGTKLGLGIGAAAGIAVIAAVEAYLGAKRANTDVPLRSPVAGRRSVSKSMRAATGAVSVSSHALQIEFLRIHF